MFGRGEHCVRYATYNRTKVNNQFWGGMTRTILSIDDEPTVTQAVRRILAHRFSVEVVDDARLAFDLLRAGKRYDAIICDVYMPLLNGMRFYEKVKELDADQAARIVFLTGGASQPAVKEFLENVPNRRLEKPFVPQELEAVLVELLPTLH